MLINERFLSVDCQDTQNICKGPLPEDIRAKSITPFHLALGLIPPGVSIAIFKAIRDLSLGEDPLAQSPLFCLLGPKSTAADIQNFLLAMGVSKEKVASLPATLDFKKYMAGQLASFLDVADLELVKSNCYDASLKLAGLYLMQPQSVRKTMDELLTKLTGDSGMFLSVITKLDYQYPKQISSINSAPLGEKIKIPVPHEFERMYFHFDPVMTSHLLKDIQSRFSDQVDEISINYESRCIFAPMCHLTNSSGTGKTRAAIELGDISNALYFKFGGDNGMPESIVGKAMLKFFHEKNSSPVHRLSAMHALHVILQRILYICGMEYQGGTLADRCIGVDSIITQYYQRALGKSIHADQLEAVVRSNLMSGLEHGTEVTSEDEKRFENDTLPTFDDNLEVKYTSDLCAPWTDVDLKEITLFNAQWLKERASKLRLSKLPEDFGVLPSLFILLDEAHALMSTDSTDASLVKVVQGKTIIDIDFYRLFRSTLRRYQIYWSHSFTLTISTIANATKFVPTKDDPSFRREIQRMHYTIVLKGSFDCFLDEVCDRNTYANWLEFLFSRERIIFIETCGRPLWGAHFIYWTLKSWEVALSKDASLQDEMRKFGICRYLRSPDQPFVVLGFNDFPEPFKKLADLVDINDSDFSFTNGVDDYKAAALLSLSVTLQKLPKGVSLDELVRVGPFALFDVNFKGDVAHAMAISEGVYNGCATIMLLKYINAIGEWLLEWVKSTDSCLLSIGEIGEVIDRIALLHAVMNASRKEVHAKLGLVDREVKRNMSEMIFEPVGFESFLAEYLGKEAADSYLLTHPDLIGSFVAFTHFIYMGGTKIDEDPYSVAAHALSRGAAVVPMRNAAGVDNLIPLVLRDGQISFVYIQVKCGTSFSGFADNTDVLSHSPELNFRKQLNFTHTGEDLKIRPNVAKKPRSTGKKDNTATERKKELNCAEITIPFAYIFRHYDGSSEEPRYKVFKKFNATLNCGDVETLFSLQPCVCVVGAMRPRIPSLMKLFDWMCNNSKIDPKFLEWNSSLSKTWNYPGNHRIIPQNELKNRITNLTKELYGELNLYNELAKKTSIESSSATNSFDNGDVMEVDG